MSRTCTRLTRLSRRIDGWVGEYVRHRSTDYEHRNPQYSTISRRGCAGNQRNKDSDRFFNNHKTQNGTSPKLQGTRTTSGSRAEMSLTTRNKTGKIQEKKLPRTSHGIDKQKRSPPISERSHTRRKEEKKIHGGKWKNIKDGTNGHPTRYLTDFTKHQPDPS